MSDEVEDKPNSQNALNSNFSTVSSLLNGMIGGTILLLPILFTKAGALSSTLILLAVGLVQYILSNITYSVLQDDQIDQDYAIRRILGDFHWKIFQLSFLVSGIMVAVFYYALIVDQLYNSLSLFLDLPGKQQIDFSQFSYQYLNLIVAVVILILVSLNELGLIFKISEVGVLSVYVYLAFIIWKFFQGLPEGYQVKPLFGDKYFSLVITLNFAFNLQGYFVTVLRINKNQNQNTYLLKIVYLISSVIYFLIGFLGMLVIQNKVSGSSSAETVMDYFANDKAISLALELLYCCHLISTLPVHLKVSRLRFSAWIEISRLTINLIFVGISFCLVFCRKFIPLQMILDFSASLFAYFIFYFYPIYTFYVDKKQQLNWAIKLGLLLLALLSLYVSVYGLVQIVLQKVQAK